MSAKQSPKEQTLEVAFSNDNLEVALTRSPGCLVTMKVKVSPAACADYYEQAAKQVRKAVTIPGFRKGKVPIDRVKRQFSRAVASEWNDLVISEVFGEALHLCKVYPWKREGAATPQLEQLSLEEGARITYSYESQPDIPPFERDQIQLTAADPIAIMESDVDRGLEELRGLWPEFEEIADRPAQIGDSVVIDLEHLDGDQTTKVFEKRKIDLKEDSQENWLNKLLLGATVGSQVEGRPDDAAEGSNYRVTVHAIAKRQPASDTSLLERTHAKDMSELTERVRRDLERSDWMRIRGALADQLWNVLYEEMPFELPRSLLESETELQVRQRLSQMRAKKQSEEEIQAQKLQIGQEAEEHVQRQFHKLFFALHIADEADCRPSDKEVTDRLQVLLQLRAIQGLELPQGKGEYAALRNKIYLDLIAERAEEWLLAPFLPPQSGQPE